MSNNEKITWNWMKTHVPMSFWVSGLSAFAVVFSIGFAVGSWQPIKDLFTNPTDCLSTNQCITNTVHEEILNREKKGLISEHNKANSALKGKIERLLREKSKKDLSTYTFENGREVITIFSSDVWVSPDGDASLALRDTYESVTGLRARMILSDGSQDNFLLGQKIEIISSLFKYFILIKSIDAVSKYIIIDVKRVDK